MQWAAWRDQIDDETTFSGSNGTDAADDTDGGDAGTGAGEPDGTDDAQESDAGATTDADPAADAAKEGSARPTALSGTHPGVRRALADAHAYVDNPPPPGRIRSSFAPGDARTLRADGPGWSLVARTDDIAFVLLDEEPGEVLPVGRGAALPGLLKALDALAVRPA